MKITEINIGDMVYFRTRNRSKYLFGEVSAIYEPECAIQVMTHNDGFQTVHIKNASFSESEIKKMKWVNPIQGS